MKKITTGLVFTLLVFFSSCKKETYDISQKLNGKWNWKSSLESNGTQMLPRDNSAIDSNFVIFSSTKFTNHAGCVIGGPSEGDFELSFVSGKQYLILKQEFYRPDTFLISITNTEIGLTEIYDTHSWTHTFTKKINN